jgi:hypothetical protein
MIDIPYVIDVKTLREFYEEYYFYRKNERIKEGYYTAYGIAILTLAITCFLSYSLLRNSSIILIATVVTVLFVSGIYGSYKFYLSAKKESNILNEQRKYLEEWYEALAKIKTSRLVLNEKCMLFYTDDAVTEYNWNEFNSFSILDDLIVLFITETARFYIVKKSVGENNFTVIQEFLSQKIKK